MIASIIGYSILCLAVIPYLGDVLVTLLPQHTVRWHRVTYDSPIRMSYPRNAWYFEVDLEKNETVCGNVTFRRQVTDIIPRFFVFRMETFKSISQDTDWINRAIFSSGQAYYYNGSEYGIETYTKNFIFRIPSADEYYFVLLFYSDKAGGQLDLYRQRAEPSLYVATWNSIRPWLGLAIFLSTTLSGILVEQGRQRRQNKSLQLLEVIYKPLLSETGKLSRQIENYEKPDLKGLDLIMQEGLYKTVDGRIRNRIDLVYRAIKDHEDGYEPSRSRSDEIISEEIQKTSSKEDFERYQRRGHDVTYKGFIANSYVGGVKLRDCLLMGKAPIQVLLEKHPQLARNRSEIKCYIGGGDGKREIVDNIAKLALDAATKNSEIQEAVKQRHEVLGQLEQLIDELAKRVT